MRGEGMKRGDGGADEELKGSLDVMAGGGATSEVSQPSSGRDGGEWRDGAWTGQGGSA